MNRLPCWCAWVCVGAIAATGPGLGPPAVGDAVKREPKANEIVARPLVARAPAHSSTIVIDDARARVWVVNPDAGTITGIDARTLAVVVEVPSGGDPGSIAQAPDGALWVANRDDATISIHDPDTGAATGVIALPRATRPAGLAFAPAGDAAYVALEATGQLVVLDPVTRATTAVIDVGPSPRAVAVSADGDDVLVTRFISPAERGEIVRVDAAARAVAGTIALAVDPGPDTESSGRGVPNYLLSVVIAPDGQQAWVAAKKDNTGRGQYVSGEPLTFESTVRAILLRIDVAAAAEITGARIDVADRALPSAIAFDPLGDVAYVATLASNTVEVVSAATGAVLASIEDVGLAPIGLAVAPAGERLYVHDFLSRDVAVFDVTGPGELERVATVRTVAVEPLDYEILLGKQIFYGSADGRMARDNYLSCAVCHLDGGSDERVWDFTDRGEGLRNTVNLRGRGGLAHGPVHWTANFDEIQDFEHDMRDLFGGTGFMSDADFHEGDRDQPLGGPKAGRSVELDALAAYVSSLARPHPSPYRQQNGALTPDGAAGAILLNRPDLGCVPCHHTGVYTDSALCADPFRLHDVGTITAASGRRLGEPLVGFDTPSLNGLWDTAPYLHDGSAPTLLDVLTTKNPNEEHGFVKHLTGTEMLQLVRYLLEVDAAAADPPCGGDLDGNCTVDIADLVTVLGAWGECPPPCPPDVDGDGAVGITDLLAVLGGWGSCP